MNKQTIIGYILIATGVFIFAMSWNSLRERNSSVDVAKPFVTSFIECEEAGYPVMESYPRQCRSADGTLFIEEIEENN
jgi:hypothetical protein